MLDIGKIKTFEKEVNLNADQKRFWLGAIESIDFKIIYFLNSLKRIQSHGICLQTFFSEFVNQAI